MLRSTVVFQKAKEEETLFFREKSTQTMERERENWMFWIPKGKKRRHLHDTQLSLLCRAKRRTLLYKSGIKNEKRERKKKKKKKKTISSDRRDSTSDPYI